jgi:iron complex transport system ATP-binding protein
MSLRTEKLAVGYNGRALLRDIGIELQPGTVLTLIGPNGSGKSTILKTLSKYLATISGTVFIENEPLTKTSAKALSKKLAVVLTGGMKPDLMTCRDIVASGRYPHTGHLGILSHEDHREVRAAMELLHAWELRDQDFRQISDGQRQRILIARALCQQPRIIVLDEPTAYLDVRYKLELLAILRQLAKERGITVVMSLHELDIAQKISDLIMCADGEEIAYYGPPDGIFDGTRIDEVFGLDHGSYDPLLGSLEFSPVSGDPEVFVIAGAGSGIPVFRDLQQRGVPFATGILHEGDLDHRLAGSLATQVFTEAAFQPISDAIFTAAAAQLRKSRSVVVTLPQLPSPGALNARNADLIALAKDLRIPIE